MRRKVGLTALALLAGVLVVPARAAAPATLRLSGRSTGYVDLTLSRPTTFDERRARITTRGSYAGWWLTRIGEQPGPKSNQAGGMRFVAQSRPGSTMPDYDFGSPATLEPGRYRLYLATDGDSVIEVPAEGLGRSVHLTPARRTSSAATTRPMDLLPGGIARGTLRQPTRIVANTLVASSVIVYSAPGAGVESLAACVVVPGGSCDDPGQPGGTTGYVVSPFTDFAVQVTAHYAPGLLDAGPYEALQGVAAGPGVTKVVGSVFQLVTVP